MTTTMTIRLDSASKSRLDKLAQATQRSKSFLAAQAIRDYLDTNEWQVQEIRAALVEADAADFASASAVADLARRWLDPVD